MVWLKVLVLFLFGFIFNGCYSTTARDREKGAYVGDFKTLQHKVSGKVWAVDEDTLYIEDFSYDGLGPDAFFWAGNETIQPQPSGVMVKYPYDSSGRKELRLRVFNSEKVLLHLPAGMKVAELKWLSVWCRRFTVNFGHVVVPSYIEPPKKRVLKEFQRIAHRVRSGNITILDAKTFYIPNLHYDGLGPDAYFWVGKGSEPDINGYKIPNEINKFDILRRYEGEDIEIQLPENKTVYDIGYLAIWCLSYKENFGHVEIPSESSLWVPPSLGQINVKLEEDAKEEGDSPQYLPSPPTHVPTQTSPPPYLPLPHDDLEHKHIVEVAPGTGIYPDGDQDLDYDLLAPPDQDISPQTDFDKDTNHDHHDHHNHDHSDHDHDSSPEPEPEPIPEPDSTGSLQDLSSSTKLYDRESGATSSTVPACTLVLLALIPLILSNFPLSH